MPVLPASSNLNVNSTIVVEFAWEIKRGIFRSGGARGSRGDSLTGIPYYTRIRIVECYLEQGAVGILIKLGQ